jgi:hypothetical protein
VKKKNSGSGGGGGGGGGGGETQPIVPIPYLKFKWSVPYIDNNSHVNNWKVRLSHFDHKNYGIY